MQLCKLQANGNPYLTSCCRKEADQVVNLCSTSLSTYLVFVPSQASPDGKKTSISCGSFEVLEYLTGRPLEDLDPRTPPNCASLLSALRDLLQMEGAQSGSCVLY